MLAVFVNTDCSVTMFSMNDIVCSNPTIDYWSQVQLTGFLFDTTTLQAALPARFAEGDSHIQCVPLPA